MMPKFVVFVFSVILFVLVPKCCDSRPQPSNATYDLNDWFDSKLNSSNFEPDTQEFVKLAWLHTIKSNLAWKFQHPSDDEIVLKRSGPLPSNLSNASQMFRNNFHEMINRPGSTFFEEYMNNASVNQKLFLEHAESFYPSCNVSETVNQEFAKQSSHMMTLFFDIKPKPLLTISSTIYQANLRLTRSTAVAVFNEGDEEFRVSVFMLLKGDKNEKRTKRLCDSKMIQLNDASPFFDFSVKKAIRNWLNNKNYGLSILVEDLDGNAINASSIFQPLKCDQTDPDKDLRLIRPFPRILKNIIVNSNGELQVLNEKSYFYGLPIMDICYSTHSNGQYSPFCEKQKPLSTNFLDFFNRTGHLL